jgi:hypothetical protein
MVLFHATFVALKAWCPLTVNTNPDEYKLAGEDRLFLGYPMLLFCMESVLTKYAWAAKSLTTDTSMS